MYHVSYTKGFRWSGERCGGAGSHHKFVYALFVCMVRWGIYCGLIWEIYSIYMLHVSYTEGFRWSGERCGGAGAHHA
jgi:hypothetical protein